MSDLDPMDCKWELLKYWDAPLKAKAVHGYVEHELYAHDLAETDVTGLHSIGVPPEIVDQIIDVFPATGYAVFFKSIHPVGGSIFTLSHDIWAVSAEGIDFPPPMTGSIHYVPESVLYGAKLYKLECPTGTPFWLKKDFGKEKEVAKAGMGFGGKLMLVGLGILALVAGNRWGHNTAKRRK